jgi:1-acyl-sn-glycerol-3-phosphate acyltransferase
LSETSTTVAGPPRRRATPEWPVLPQWVITIIRTVLRGVFAVLWRTRYVGLKNLPVSGGVIIAANHQTYIDPFWVAVVVNRPVRFLAWNESFKWPIVGKLIGMLGAWPIQLEKSDPTAIRRSLQWLRGGGAVVIFPEGGRAFSDGLMARFKNGAVRLALEANVPILPVTIRGGNRVWPKGYRFPRLASVHIIYHGLFKACLLPGEDTRACARRATERLAQIIGSAL